MNSTILKQSSHLRMPGFIATFALCASLSAAELSGDRIPTRDGDLTIHPIDHATLAMGWKDLVIYVDPVGAESRYAALPKPDLILITDIHGDHLDTNTLKVVMGDKASVIAPAAVAELLPTDLRARTTILSNSESREVSGIVIDAVPMYNLTPERTRYHSKGRGNGYVLTFADKRVYVSGDTEDIPEMRALKNIDVAFVCMNLPYTMTVDQAASAVREFKPKIVYPYHHRGSEVEKFKQLVGTDAGIEVRIREWYKP